MHMTVFRDRKARNAETSEDTVIPAGRHEIEAVENPLDPRDEPWFVLRGTLIGGCMGYWRRFEGDGWFEDEVFIEIEE